ncbi:hypothetical protein niasHT_032683 [Heterodera trifolii]|uniref:J domain-containing protein n=1 Tax=Heterodera trifolii TaxID=157864 RepID=A0ABD2IWW5_9BILA
MRDFYSLLNCDKSASAEQLKQAYFQQLRKCHPDKNNSLQQLDPFLDLVRAWKVLSDTVARTNYDCWLCEQQFRVDKELIFDEIWLNASAPSSPVVPFGGDFEEDCRCGGIYQVSAEAVEQLALDYLLVDCSNCSLTLRVWRCASCPSPPREEAKATPAEANA